MKHVHATFISLSAADWQRLTTTVHSSKPIQGAQVSPPPYAETRMEQKDAKGTKEEKREEATR